MSRLHGIVTASKRSSVESEGTKQLANEICTLSGTEQEHVRSGNRVPNDRKRVRRVSHVAGEVPADALRSDEDKKIDLPLAHIEEQRRPFFKLYTRRIYGLLTFSFLISIIRQPAIVDTLQRALTA